MKKYLAALALVGCLCSVLLVIAFITRDKEKSNPDEPEEVVEEVDTGVKTVQQAVTVEEPEEEPEGLTEIDGVLYTEGGGRYMSAGDAAAKEFMDTAMLNHIDNPYAEEVTAATWLCDQLGATWDGISWLSFYCPMDDPDNIYTVKVVLNNEEHIVVFDTTTNKCALLSNN